MKSGAMNPHVKRLQEDIDWNRKELINAEGEQKRKALLVRLMIHKTVQEFHRTHN